MAIYRSVHLSFWTDNKVEDDFTPEDKYFYLYLLTNPQTNICGCYEVSYSQMSHQTGYNKDTLERLLDRFEKFHNVIRYCRATKEILVLHWYKYNWSKSKDTLRGVLNVAQNIKCEEFRDYIQETVEYIEKGILIRPPVDTREGSDTVSDPDTEPVPVADSDSDKKKEKPQKHRYGEYSHVFLTDAQLERLVNDYGEAETQEAIKLLDEYIQMKGYKAKDHNLAIRKWVFRAINENAQKNRVVEMPQSRKTDWDAV